MDLMDAPFEGFQRVPSARSRPIGVLLLILHLGACTSWRPATVSPRQVMEDDEPEVVRITLTDGERVTLLSPEVRGDTISGIRESFLREQ